MAALGLQDDDVGGGGLVVRGGGDNGKNKQVAWGALGVPREEPSELIFEA